MQYTRKHSHYVGYMPLGLWCNGLCGPPARKLQNPCRLTIFLRKQLC